MNSYQEPPNGDFVAYIETLQRESAARIHLRAHATAAERPAAGHAPAESQSALHSEPGAPVLSRQQAEELVARLARSGHSPQTAKAAIGFAAGLLLLFFWLFGGGGAVPFLVGVALVAWSASALRRAWRAGTAPGSREHARIEQLFGKKPPA